MLDDDRWKAVTTVGYLAHPETLKHRPCRSHAVNVTMLSPADPAEEAEGALVRLEHHLLARAREDLNQLHPAVAEPHVRRLYPGRHTRQAAYSWLQSNW